MGLGFGFRVWGLGLRVEGMGLFVFSKAKSLLGGAFVRCRTTLKHPKREPSLKNYSLGSGHRDLGLGIGAGDSGLGCLGGVET